MFCAITHTARFTIIKIITYFAILCGKNDIVIAIYIYIYFLNKSSGEMLRQELIVLTRTTPLSIILFHSNLEQH